jgi:hypothetical protein
MTEAKYGGLIVPVAEFVQTLGDLPDDCPIEVLQDRDATLVVRVKKGMRDVADFHPKIDSQLLEVDLEEVIVYSVKNHYIEFDFGMLGVTAERCYQTEVEEKGELPDKEILRTWRQVHQDYGDIFLDDSEAIMRASREYEAMKERTGPVVRFARRVVSAFSGK